MILVSNKIVNKQNTTYNGSGNGVNEVFESHLRVAPFKSWNHPSVVSSAPGEYIGQIRTCQSKDRSACFKRRKQLLLVIKLKMS